MRGPVRPRGSSCALGPARAALLGGTLALATACGSSLPEPDSAGARVLASRCAGCHRVYAPGLMTADMWRYQVDRMRALFAQRGIPWLSPADETALLAYLTTHAGGS